jgi:outer membrane protein
VSVITVSCSQDKSAYIDVSTVFSEFNLSQKLEKEREIITKARQGILDSLQLQLNQFSKQFEFKVDSNQVKYFNQKRQEYYYKEKQFDEDNQALLREHNEQSMKQLNEYIKEYGETNGYKFIFGATGNGSMMFAEEGANISIEVVSFANDKYNGVE